MKYLLVLITISYFTSSIDGLERSFSENNVIYNAHRTPNQLTRQYSLPRYGQCSKDYSFDYLILAIQWPPGFCRTSPRQCEIEPQNFTIHGMWPTQGVSKGPSYCCFDNTFDVTLLDPIRKDLDKYWPSLYSKDPSSFWSHEWLKHGTCTRDIVKMKGELEFFGSTLNNFKSLNVMENLEKANIVPSSETPYTASEIRKALQGPNGGFKIGLDCDYEHDNKVPILTGFEFCFDNKLRQINCRSTKFRCNQSVRFVSS